MKSAATGFQLFDTLYKNRENADILVSIHLNSNRGGIIGAMLKGTTVFYHGGMEGLLGDSGKLAKSINDAVGKNTSLSKNKIRRDHGNLGILTESYMVAVLTETGYMGADIAYLSNNANLKLIGNNIALGIVEHLSCFCP